MNIGKATFFNALPYFEYEKNTHTCHMYHNLSNILLKEYEQRVDRGNVKKYNIVQISGCTEVSGGLRSTSLIRPQKLQQKKKKRGSKYGLGLAQTSYWTLRGSKYVLGLAQSSYWT